MSDMTEALTDSDKRESEEQVKILDIDLPLCFTEDRHLEPIEGIECITQTWRMKDRMKTVSVALVLCLNVGVDPPDVVKTVPCARLECWIDPTSLTPSKALERIGSALQSQYERWQPRARYKQTLDPTVDEVKKLCISLRKNAKEERVLFHYNGHGVPKPTTNGEIWVFNRQYTQYIPLSIYDLQAWMGAPSIYVYDCSNAGIIVESFKQFAAQHESEYEQASEHSRVSSPCPPDFKNCIQLAACSANQFLPMNPDLPADVFTSCLTTPIKLALRWFIQQNTVTLVPGVTQELLDKIPGQISDRRTMLGELNWIFTAITDTIAWNVLPRDLFQMLFRQDLLVASLFRNFLLAERIMRSCDCTPVSSPSLPPTHQHPMWDAWDYAVDLCLVQLPRIVNQNEPFEHLPFFEDQLTAFQVWLQGVPSQAQRRAPPEQLPIVLQVLLSQVHRVRALELLGRFLDLGPWAVSLALSVGIFPYVLKLLQSSARELRPLLVFIWAKILAVDNSCQADLVRDGGHKYFLSVLQDPTVSCETRTQAVFVLACIVKNYHEGQVACLQGSLISICLEQLHDVTPSLKQWVAICVGRVWENYEKAKWTGARDLAYDKLYVLLDDPCPEVRAAGVYALGTFISSAAERSDHATSVDGSVITTLIKVVSNDYSCLVRKELINALQWMVLSFEHVFFSIALKEENSANTYFNEFSTAPVGMRRVPSRDRLRINEDTVSNRIPRVNSSSSIQNMLHQSPMNQANSSSLGTLSGLVYGSSYTRIWSALTSLEMDPHPEVADMCSTITKYIRDQVKDHMNRDNDNKANSASLPPSPKRGNYLSGDSPPTMHSPADLQKLTRQTMPNRRRRVPNTINEENEDRSHQPRKPLVTTQFLSWASKRFTQSDRKQKPLDDYESREYHERDWRFIRNNKVREEGKDEERLALVCKLESQIFNTKTAVAPSVIKFHPYDTQVAVAGKDSFAIWNWGTAAKTTSGLNKSLRIHDSKITAMEWMNAHDLGMLLVAANDGSVRLWKPNRNATCREPQLITAWQAFPDVRNKLSAVVMSWEQWTQTVVTAGDSRFLRFWDAEREIGCLDIPSGTDAAVTCLDSSFAGGGTSLRHQEDGDCCPPEGEEAAGAGDSGRKRGGVGGDGRQGLVVVGCADGSVKVFDRRCAPNDARVFVWPEHEGAVLGVQLRGDEIVSGSVQGVIKVFDIRQSQSVLTTDVLPNFRMSCIAVHRNADLYACGSITQSISIHNMRGTQLNQIKFYEGFMGNRIGPVKCLDFHPHRVLLATGTGDCSVLVYSLEGRR